MTDSTELTTTSPQKLPATKANNLPAIKKELCNLCDIHTNSIALLSVSLKAMRAAIDDDRLNIDEMNNLYRVLSQHEKIGVDVQTVMYELSN